MMIHQQRNIRFQRAVALLLTLLISNFAALTCAMAYALCADCPDHPSLVCEQPCGTSVSVISEKYPDNSTNTFRPVLSPHGSDTDATGQAVGNVRAIDRHASVAVPVVPLRLQFCVFLK